MSEKEHKTQAGKAASAAKSKTSASSKIKTNNQKSNFAGKSSQSQPKLQTRSISAIIFICLFVIFLICILLPDGSFLEGVNRVMDGLIGRVGYVVLIPVLLYLFIIHAFSGERPIKARTICLAVFTLSVGCLAHIVLNISTKGRCVGDFEGLGLIKALYEGGSATTGGIICGGLMHYLAPPAGSILPILILSVTAILTLLGSMQITIPSIIRAIENRPKPNVKTPVKERPEPATLIVNHIANKRIEYIERQQKEAEITKQQQLDLSESSITNISLKKTDSVKKTKAEQIMQEIELDTDEPVIANADEKRIDDGPEIIPVLDKSPKKIPIDMPAFDPESPLQEAPVLEETPEEQPIKAKVDKVTAKDAEESAAELAQEIAEAAAVVQPEYCYPPIDLLKCPSGDMLDGTAEMRENTRRLNETLASFKIEAHIINVTRGPSVTRYEVELEKGVRLSKLTTAADDIALSLGATGVRIASVPGKISIVGIEVPNRAVTTVSLREVIDSNEFSKSKSKSSFAVGKDIGGNCIVGNISKLPHMLIAGTTGSGKSVCMNSIIISLLYKAGPEDVKLIMIDPKMVELGIYNGIPHLLIPVVTDPKKAAGSLQWAVTEMMRRYKAMSDAGVRDLESYNSIIETQEVEGTKLPQVVVIIDELADLMLVAAKEVEESICRIAQMGRAAGIHLIIATQRPSANVITGLMKANIPSRIAFAVASAMESRIILDTQGAEKLVGKGDMLYAPIGNGKPRRVQGCFVSDTEVESVANYVKSNFTTDYDQQIMEEIEKQAAQTGTKSAAAAPEPSNEELDCDEMLPAAVDVILETGQASVSMLQRRLKLGYARAARIVDEMEDRGIVGPFVGSKPRAILVTKEQWAAMQSGGNLQMGISDLDSNESDSDCVY